MKLVASDKASQLS